ncbi:EamA family transporter [Sulfoacidibacillus thermotolerans]|uniref:EamA domain-containing protein n=1 Tax=Sulfoacidibacillus thermotolerans TaxID=1765684 RepID=A0A2U3D6M5_SULT2|nr:EamA family transporter [Sulfoacidibacillus thermotolerans]PWI56903.1 hypothetical protein BM613_11305 [Sulfoacidibacillus thermotolerans]
MVCGYVFELIFGTILAYLVQIFAQKWSNPTHVMIILSVEGPSAFLFAWLFWGGSMQVFKVSGALFIIIAVMITEWFGASERVD